MAAYEAALRDESHCWVHSVDGQRNRVPVGRWLGQVDASDRLLLSACKGITLDVGCGPGRLTVGLIEQGTPALGVDISPVAVRLARRRGAPVLQQDFFDRLPGEGRWATVLLADGNLGIGGDPRRLLGRVREVLRPQGRVVLDLDHRVSGVVRSRVLLSSNVAQGWMDWAHVGPDAIHDLAGKSGLEVERVETRPGGRPFAVLVKP